MRIHVRDLAAGDLLVNNDWVLHVTGVDHDRGVVVTTAEFGFPVRFVDDELVDVAIAPEAA